MKAIVVYESLWGNTAAIARAIAEGLGPGAEVLSTAEATADKVAGVDLIVAGSPVLAFKLPTEQIRESLRSKPLDAPAPADLSHPSMRSWLMALPMGNGDHQGAGEEGVSIDHQAAQHHRRRQVRPTQGGRDRARPRVGR
jgi:hypothetical protein